MTEEEKFRQDVLSATNICVEFASMRRPSADTMQEITHRLSTFTVEILEEVRRALSKASPLPGVVSVDNGTWVDRTSTEYPHRSMLEKAKSLLDEAIQKKSGT